MSEKNRIVKAYSSSSMVKRFVTGILAAVGFSTLIFVPHRIPVFAIGIAVVSILAAKELYSAVRRQGGEPTNILGYLACVVFQFAAWTHNGTRFVPYLPMPLVLLVLACLLVELVKQRPKPILNIGATLLGAIYVGWLCSYLTLLHGANSAYIHPPIRGTTTGQWIVMFVATTTWISDTAALFMGKLLGKNKLAPSISPNKTWEGSAGGIVVSLLTGGVLIAVLKMPIIPGLGLAALCAVSGQLGDLCESAMKRDLGLKDFGDMLPGMGGVLDRIDSILFAAPLAYYFIVLLNLAKLG